MIPESVLTLFGFSRLFRAPKINHLWIQAMSTATENADILVPYSETTLYAYHRNLNSFRMELDTHGITSLLVASTYSCNIWMRIYCIYSKKKKITPVLYLSFFCAFSLYTSNSDLNKEGF